MSKLRLEWREQYTQDGATLYIVEDRDKNYLITIHKNMNDKYNINTLDRPYLHFKGNIEEAKLFAEKRLKEIAEGILKMYL